MTVILETFATFRANGELLKSAIECRDFAAEDILEELHHIAVKGEAFRKGEHQNPL